MPLPGLWGANQYSQFTKEAAWGTFDPSAAVKPWVELESGALDVRRTPLMKDDRAATQNLRSRRVADRYEVTADFKTHLFPDLMLAFVPWICTPTVVSGRLTLPSFTVDWFDGNEPRRFRGMRVEEATLDFAADAQWGELTMKLRGRDQDSTPPTMVAPALSEYPQVNPTVLTDTAGFCTFNGAALTGYRSFKLTVKNRLDPQFDEFPVLNSLEYCGRDVDAEFVAKVTGTVRKGLYEAQTPIASYFKWAATGAGPLTYTTIFDLQATNYVGNRTADRNFDKTQYETVSLQAFRDATSGLDMVATSTAA